MVLKSFGDFAARDPAPSNEFLSLRFLCDKFLHQVQSREVEPHSRVSFLGSVSEKHGSSHKFRIKIEDEELVRFVFDVHNREDPERIGRCLAFLDCYLKANGSNHGSDLSAHDARLLHQGQDLVCCGFLCPGAQRHDCHDHKHPCCDFAMFLHCCPPV